MDVGYTVVNSIYPGNSSLMLNGYFNLSDPRAEPVLTYQRLYDLEVKQLSSTWRFRPTAALPGRRSRAKI